MMRDLVLKNRSYRRFYQEIPVSIETLRELVDLARLSASASNRQPLKYVLSCDLRKNSVIFPNLAWAGYLKGWPGPEEGERPSAYVVILGDKTITQSFGSAHGIADGLAPRALTRVWNTGLGMTRILSPFMSSGVRTGRLLLVKWRTPLSANDSSRTPVFLIMSSENSFSQGLS